MLGIHLRGLRRLALGLTLRATLGIPWSSVGSEAVGVGADRLARALAATAASVGAAGLSLLRLLSLGALDRRLLRLLAGRRTEPRLLIATRPAIAPTLAATLATFAAGATGTAGAARTPRTTWPAGTATAAIASIATRATAAAAATATFHVTRRGGQLPADPRARHLAATRAIVLLGLVLLRTDLEAAETARLVAAIAAGATATAAAAIAAASTITTAAAVAIVAPAPPRRTGDAIDRVVKLAARDRAVRRRLALEHAHEPHLLDAVADDVERLDQPRRAIGLQVQLGRDRVDHRIGLGVLRRGFGLRRVLCCRLGRCLTLRSSRIGRGLRRWLRLGCRRGRGGRDHGGRDRTEPGADLRSLAQGQRRELGQRLHGR